MFVWMYMSWEQAAGGGSAERAAIRAHIATCAVWRASMRGDFLGELRKLDPALLLGRDAGGDRHHQGNEAVLARARRRRVVDEAVDKGERLLHVRLLVWCAGTASSRRHRVSQEPEKLGGQEG